MAEKEKLTIEQMGEVSGGTIGEFNELRTALRAKYTISDDDVEAARQISRILRNDYNIHVAYSRAIIDPNMKRDVANVYYVNEAFGNDELTHAQMMDLIREQL